MLPGQLQAQYGNDPGYQNYLKWHQETGGRWGWWSDEAAKAAQAAGINMHLDTTGWKSWQTPWGEGLMDNPNTPEATDSATNPAWTTFIKDFMAKHGPGTAYNQGGGDPNFIPDDIRAQLGMSPNGAPAGGGQGGGGLLPTQLGTLDPRLPDGGINLDANVDWLGQRQVSADPFQNSIAARFIARTQQESGEQQAQRMREFIRKIMLAGQGAKQPVSPGLVAAAMPRGVA
jgi:hypothetical protein